MHHCSTAFDHVNEIRSHKFTNCCQNDWQHLSLVRITGIRLLGANWNALTPISNLMRLSTDYGCLEITEKFVKNCVIGFNLWFLLHFRHLAAAVEVAETVKMPKKSKTTKKLKMQKLPEMSKMAKLVCQSFRAIVVQWSFKHPRTFSFSSQLDKNMRN